MVRRVYGNWVGIWTQHHTFFREKKSPLAPSPKGDELELQLPDDAHPHISSVGESHNISDNPNLLSHSSQTIYSPKKAPSLGSKAESASSDLSSRLDSMSSSKLKVNTIRGIG